MSFIPCQLLLDLLLSCRQRQHKLDSTQLEQRQQAYEDAFCEERLSTRSSIKLNYNDTSVD